MDLRRNTGAVLLVLLFVSLVVPALADSPNTVAALAARINAERVARGLPPYALNAQLSAAAQAHAQDIAKTGKYGHTGSDGSTLVVRVGRVGYGEYSWGRRVGENYAVYRSIDDAMGFWMKSKAHRENILHEVYREIGIGLTPANQWGATVYVLNFGAQPNILPIFINNGADSTQSPNVTITLTEENALPAGEGKMIGRPKQVQVSNSPDFADADWQPYADKIPWTLPASGGAKTVYVKYRDANGRTATSSDSITLGGAAMANQAAVVTATRTATPRPTSTPRPTATNTRRPTSTVTRTPRPSATPTDTPEPTETVTPTPEVIEIAQSAQAITSIPLIYLKPTVAPLPTAAVAGLALETGAPIDALAGGIFAVGFGLGILAIIKFRSRRTPPNR
ncbi:MAG: hypothetical protein HY782_28785 [Chloroflexi bacterium]|nr:hypothetical protein [Chloroflexota bacterium]